MSLSVTGFILAVLSFQVEPTVELSEEKRGFIEFSRADIRKINHSIKIFLWFGKNRIRYIDEIGTEGDRMIKLQAPEGKHKFVVVIQPVGDRVSAGAPSNVVRRRRPNVEVDVVAGHTTSVSVGGFTDFARGPSQGDPFGTKFVRPLDVPEASQFRTQITVGKPEKR